MSITYWSRLEPRPRNNSLRDPLAARMRDPLWFLARQWQMGEYQGEDAGSPAGVQLASKTASVMGYRAVGERAEEWNGSAPLEQLAEAESIVADLSLAVELGQMFETLLEKANLNLISDFRSSFPFAPPSETDTRTNRFASFFTDRALDGAELYFASAAVIGDGRLDPKIDAILHAHPVVLPVLQDFQRWVQEVFGKIQRKESFIGPSSWMAERLEYDLEILCANPEGGIEVLAAHPDEQGTLSWSSFDVRPGARVDLQPPAQLPPTETLTTIPMHVRFRGMPSPRWWDFETGKMDFGDIKADKVDLSKAIFMDFMLIHGNDWFMMPFNQNVGTICEVQMLTVFDVFGGSTPVLPADFDSGPKGERWTMFSTSVEGSPNQLSHAFIMPPTAASAVQTGQTLEEVRFFRDEVADMAWALEYTIQNGLGEPKFGHEEHIEKKVRPNPPAPLPSMSQDKPAIRYSIENAVPENWYPLLPGVVDQTTHEFMFQRGTMDYGNNNLPPPLGLILKPQGVLRIREQEISRSGIRIARSASRSRWVDGSTHVWIARSRTVGSGEGSSGLKFDGAIPNA